jgi:signal transduction histidine kinase
MAAEVSYPKLISFAVHELRTPVGVIAGYLRMLGLDSQSPLDDRQRRMIDEANKSCARLVTLLSDLSDLSKMDDGTVRMASQPVDLFALVADVASSVHEAEDRDVRLAVQGSAEGGRILGDIDRLRGALQAIFVAILREKPGPAIVAADRRVVSSGAGPVAVIVVSENEQVQAACEARRGAFDEKRGGVGLSLPLARRVIEAHGGQLWSPDLPDARTARGIALIELPLAV